MYQSKTWETEGIVLRTYPIGESDRIVLMLTPNNGLVRLMAKGVRRPGSRFGGNLEPGCMISAQLYRGRTFHFVQQIDLLEPYQNLRADYSLSVVSALIAEAISKVAQEEERDLPLFLGLKDALKILNNKPSHPANIAHGALIKICISQGQIPSPDMCAIDNHIPLDRDTVSGFSVAAGGFLCEEHTTNDLWRVDSFDYDSWKFLCVANLDDISEMELSPNIAMMVYRWFSYQLNIELKSWESLKDL